MEPGPGQMNALFSNAASYYIIHHHSIQRANKVLPYLHPLLKIRFIILNYVHVCVCVGVYAQECRCLWTPKVLYTLEAGVTGSYAAPNMGSGN